MLFFICTTIFLWYNAMRMKVEKIYFDMDGVLVDFNKGVYDLTDYDGILDKDQKQSDGIWNYIKNVPNFYFKLEPFDDMLELFKVLWQKYGSKCEILTGLPRPERGIETAGQDKVLWVKKYMGEDIKVNLVMREEKQNFCKNKGCILIDDLPKNVNEWTKKGGVGILHDDAKSTKIALKNLEIL